RRIPVRILHFGDDHERLRFLEKESASVARRDRQRDGWEPLPLRGTQRDPRGDRGGGAMRTSAIDRRDFCKLLGGGVLVLIATPPLELFAQRRISYPDDPNAYLRIDEHGNVTLFSGKIEMGQGVMTSLAQECAEELGAPIDKIKVVMGDTDLCPWDAGTWGSLSTRFFGPAVRAASAEARAVMMNLASQKLGVPKEKLTVSNGVVSDGSKKITYGELAKGKSITRLVGEKAVLRTVKEYK